jgi:hypothetical protein
MVGSASDSFEETSVDGAHLTGHRSIDGSLMVKRKQVERSGEHFVCGMLYFMWIYICGHQNRAGFSV